MAGLSWIRQADGRWERTQTTISKRILKQQQRDIRYYDKCLWGSVFTKTHDSNEAYPEYKHLWQRTDEQTWDLDSDDLKQPNLDYSYDSYPGIRGYFSPDALVDRTLANRIYVDHCSRQNQSIDITSQRLEYLRLDDSVVRPDSLVLLKDQEDPVENGVYYYNGRTLERETEFFDEQVVFIEGGKRQKDRLFEIRPVDLDGNWPGVDDEKVYDEGDLWLLRHEIGYILWDDFVFKDAILFSDNVSGQDVLYGVMIADQGLMLSITYDGTNVVYKPVDLPTKENINVLAVSDGYWWAGGDNGLLLRLPVSRTDHTSVDAFTDWEKVKTDTFFDLKDISFLPESEFGVITGENGLVLFSNDSGDNWTTQRVSDKFVKDYNQIHIESENRFYLVGERGYLVRLTRHRRVNGYYMNRILIKRSFEFDSLVETDFHTIRPLVSEGDDLYPDYSDWLVVTGDGGLVAFYNTNSKLEDGSGNDLSFIDNRIRLYELDANNEQLPVVVTGPQDDPDGRPYVNRIIGWRLYDQSTTPRIELWTSRGILFDLETSLGQEPNTGTPIQPWDFGLDVTTLNERQDFILLDDFRYLDDAFYQDSSFVTLGKIWECATSDVVSGFGLDLTSEDYLVTSPPASPPDPTLAPVSSTTPDVEYLYDADSYLAQLDTNLLIADYFLARKFHFLREGVFKVPEIENVISNLSTIDSLKFERGEEISALDKEYSNSTNALDYLHSYFFKNDGLNSTRINFEFTRNTVINDVEEVPVLTEPDRQLYLLDQSTDKYLIDIEDGRLKIELDGSSTSTNPVKSLLEESDLGDAILLDLKRDGSTIFRETFIIRHRSNTGLTLQERFDEGIYGQISNDLFYGNANSYVLSMFNLNKYDTADNDVSLVERINTHPLSAYYGANSESGSLNVRGRSFVGSSRERVVTTCRPAAELSPSSTGDYWTFSTQDGSDYHVWYDVDSGNSAPSLASTPIEVDVTLSDTEIDVARKTYLAISSNIELSSFYDGDVVYVTGDSLSGDPDSASVGTTTGFVSVLSPYSLIDSYNAWYYNLRTRLVYDQGGIFQEDVKYDPKDLFTPDYTLAYYLSRTYGLTPVDLALTDDILDPYSYTFTGTSVVNKFSIKEDFGLNNPPEAGFYYDLIHPVDGTVRNLLVRVIQLTGNEYILEFQDRVNQSVGYSSISKRTTLQDVSEDLESSDDFHRRIFDTQIDGIDRKKVDGDTNKINPSSYVREIMQQDVIRSFFTSYLFTDDNGQLAFFVTDPYFDRNLKWLPIDLFPTGADLMPQKALEVLAQDFDVTNLDSPELVEKASFNDDESADRMNFRLIHGLALPDVWNEFFWLLNAKVKRAVISRSDEPGRIEWYQGDWICGRWEDGIWWNGRWFTGTWIDGEFHSRFTEDRYTEVKVFDEETRLQSKWYSGNFLGGTWFDGTWYDGYWQDATHIDGDWFDGFWFDGKWLNGNWRGGTWRNGTWENGIWNGFSAPAIWWNGIWNQGYFENGTWVFGIWNSTPERQSLFGTKSTLYRPSKWFGGTWNGGRWFASLSNKDYRVSRWYSGTWNDGFWYNGIWYEDKSEDILALQNDKGDVVVRTPAAQRESVWNGGKWHNGVWQDGEWFDGEWLRGVWLDGTWYDGIRYSGHARKGRFLGGTLGKLYRPARKKRRQKPVYL